jgi:TonB-dependent starch-binding outer membrane protein SusC
MPSQGFLESQLRNVGELRNRGFELGLNANVIRRANYGLELGAYGSTNRSKVLSLGDSPEFSLGNFGWIVEGAPVPVIRAACVQNRGATGPDADPIIEENCEYGPANPTRTIGGSTSIHLPHGMLVTLRGEHQGGHFIYDLAAFNAVTRSVIWAGCYNVYRIEELQGRDAVPAEERARCDAADTRADFHIYPADFFKLREISFHAPVPDRLVPGGSRATFTLSGRNIWRWVKDEFRTFDPEMSNNDGFETAVRSISEHVPQPSLWTASIRVNF